MKFGVMTGADLKRTALDDLIAVARRAEQAGFDSLWMANIFGLDAISTLTVLGRETTRLELGTAVTPTYPRHPTALAQQALTAAAASANRFVLGIGVSHKTVVEDMLGLDFTNPARHLREYLEVLRPLLRGESVTHAGRAYRLNGVQLAVPGVQDVPVVVAALGARMLALAGELADGTSTWMVGPKTLAAHIVPGLRAAAAAAGRPQPRVIVGLPILLTNDVDTVRARLAKGLAMYGRLPSYRAMLDREGLAGPADVALLGDEATLRASLVRIAEAGATDLNASILDLGDGGYERTFEFLASIRDGFRSS